jgi:hypothetical protein
MTLTPEHLLLVSIALFFVGLSLSFGDTTSKERGEFRQGDYKKKVDQDERKLQEVFLTSADFHHVQKSTEPDTDAEYRIKIFGGDFAPEGVSFDEYRQRIAWEKEKP